MSRVLFAILVSVCLSFVFFKESAAQSQPSLSFRGNECVLDYDICIPGLIVHMDQPVTFFVFADVRGYREQGITGVEFAIHGLPEGWISVVTKAPIANIVLGDPFQGRVNVVFPTCETGLSGEIPLMSVTVIATSLVQDRWLHVVAADSPSSPNYKTPIATKCDVSFTAGAAWGGRMVINPVTVATESIEWSGIKQLYRE